MAEKSQLPGFVLGILAGVAITVCLAARAPDPQLQPSPEKVASVHGQLIEEQRWAKFIDTFYTWTQHGKLLSWPENIRNQIAMLMANSDVLEADLRVSVDKAAPYTSAETRLPGLKAERLQLIREIYKDVLKVKDLELSTQLFREGAGQPNSK